MKTTSSTQTAEIDALIAAIEADKAAKATAKAAAAARYAAAQLEAAESAVCALLAPAPAGLGQRATITSRHGTNNMHYATAKIAGADLRLKEIEVTAGRSTSRALPEEPITLDNAQQFYDIQVKINAWNFDAGNDRGLDWPAIIAQARRLHDEMEATNAKAEEERQIREAEAAEQKEENDRQYAAKLARYKDALIEYATAAIEADRHNQRLIAAWNAEQAAGAFWLTLIEYGVTSEDGTDTRERWSLGKDSAGYYRTLERIEDHTPAGFSAAITYKPTWRKYAHIVSETAPAKHTAESSPIKSRISIYSFRANYDLIAPPDAGAAFMFEQAYRIECQMYNIPTHPIHATRDHYGLADADRHAAAGQASEALQAAGYTDDEIARWLEE